MEILVVMVLLYLELLLLQVASNCASLLVLQGLMKIRRLSLGVAPQFLMEVEGVPSSVYNQVVLLLMLWRLEEVGGVRIICILEVMVALAP